MGHKDNDIKDLTERLLRLEQRVQALEQAARQPNDAAPEVETGQTIALPVEQPTLFYAPSLNGLVFKLEDRYTPGTTIYKVNTQEKTFVLDDRATELILRDRRGYLQYGCQHKGIGDKYELVHAGTIRLNNNNQWEVATPIEIKWKGDK